jgi:hypothetical protein
MVAKRQIGSVFAAVAGLDCTVQFNLFGDVLWQLKKCMCVLTVEVISCGDPIGAVWWIEYCRWFGSGPIAARNATTGFSN